MSNPDGEQSLQGPALALVTVALALATFMNVLDTTITNVAIPAIAGSLAVSPSQGTWVITAFVVATAITVPLTGWLAQRIGEVKLFIGCTAAFTLLSWSCGLASDFHTLLLLRILQGAVAGPMIPLSQSLLIKVFPADRRGMALAIWAMTTVVAPVLGPIFGGWLTDNYSWPWIFYINIPVGAFSVAVTWLMLRHRDTPVQHRPIDIVGLLLLIVWVGALQILLDNGNDMGWFGSQFIVHLAEIAIVCLIFFLIWEWYEPHPVIDFSLFRSRNFNIAVIAITLGFGTYFGGIVIFPLWLQTQMGYTATWAGIAAAPVGLLAIVFSPLVGKSLHRVDLRIFVTISFLVFSFCSFWLGRFSTQVTLMDLIEPRLLMGIGVATFFVPLTALSLSGLTPDRIASASGVANFLRTLGASFGTSLSVTLWDRRAYLHDVHLSENFTISNPVSNHFFDQLHAMGLSTLQVDALFASQVQKQAFMLATNDFFWLSGWLFLALMALVWLARPPFAPKGATPPPAAE